MSPSSSPSSSPWSPAVILIALVASLGHCERPQGEGDFSRDENSRWFYQERAAARQLEGGGGGGLRGEDLMVKPGSPAARSVAVESKYSKSALYSSTEHLLEEAERHLDEDELTEYDLDKEADVARLRATIARLQAETAEFAFGYSIQDGISDSFVQRTEERNGLLTKGHYSYSDGFRRQTVHYEADENGYRVTSMETEEIGSGPVTNKEGKAFVQSLQHGFQSTYAIMGKQGAEDEQDGAVGEEGEEAQEEAEIEVEGRDRENRGSILPLLIHQSRLVEEYDN